MHKLKLIDEAKEELRKEIAYSKKRWGAVHARKYSKGLRESIKVLQKNPQLCPLRPDILPEIRIHTYKGNRIVYVFRESPAMVVILAVLSNFQDLEKGMLRKRQR